MQLDTMNCEAQMSPPSTMKVRRKKKSDFFAQGLKYHCNLIAGRPITQWCSTSMKRWESIDERMEERVGGRDG